jgi:hypothetical protein
VGRRAETDAGSRRGRPAAAATRGGGGQATAHVAAQLRRPGAIHAVGRDIHHLPGGERTRKVQHLIYAPTFEAAGRITATLSKIRNLASDGRHILGLDSRHILEITLDGGPGCYLVPAHAWTPRFAVLGSKSGFDVVADCFGDLAAHVFAIETGSPSIRR